MAHPAAAGGAGRHRPGVLSNTGMVLSFWLAGTAD
jgi:hypothetical protein